MIPADQRATSVPDGPPLTTKLHIPQRRGDLVVRPQLLQRLDANLRLPVTLVAAPPGYGKTTLLATWAATQPNAGIAWLSLDPNDNDPLRFLTYIIAALHTSHAELHLRVPDPFPAPHQVDPTMVITSVLNALTRFGRPLLLILDDYHHITTRAIQDLVTLFIDRMPPHVHLALLSRSDPPLPLYRWRARGQLGELRAADLRFTHDEASIFLHHMLGVSLPTTAVIALEERTEGWIAGLQLAALSLQGHTQHEHVVGACAGSQRYIMDYLVDEVLDRQPAPIREFLLITGLLDRLCGPLCADLLTHDDTEQPSTADAARQPLVNGSESGAHHTESQRILEHLERANLFLIPLDNERCWYRYHHLFADLLRHRLQAAHPERVVVLHRRAAAWFAGQDLHDEAIKHALAAGDHFYAAGFIEAVGRRFLTRGEVTTVRRWLAELPPDLTTTRPQLALIAAWVSVWLYQPDAVERMVQQVKQAVTSDPDHSALVQAELLALQAFVVRCRNDWSESIALSQRALDSLPPDSAFLRGFVAGGLGDLYWVLEDVPRAVHFHTTALAAARTIGDLVVMADSVSALVQFQLMQGRLHMARATNQQGVTYMIEQDGPTSPFIQMQCLGAGSIAYEQNQLEDAQEHLLAGIRHAERCGLSVYLPFVYAELGRTAIALGDQSGAITALQYVTQSTAQMMMHADGQAPPWIYLLRLRQVEILIALDDITQAVHAIQDYRVQIDDNIPMVKLVQSYTLSKVLIAGWQRPDLLTPLLSTKESPLTLAQQLLTPCIQRLQARGLYGVLLDMLMLQATLFQRQGQTVQALQVLEQALELAAPEEYVQVFLNYGTPMADLLAHIARSESPTSAYAARLLPAFSPNGTLPTAPKDSPAHEVSYQATSLLIEPLSERELEVLRLIAAGLSNRAIANQLLITVGTARRHTHNIYGKLGVKSRTQAIAQARAFNLLP